MQNKHILSTIDAAIIVLVILLIVLASPFVIAQFKSQSFEDTYEIARFCVNTDIVDASRCVVGVTNQFYKYNIDNIGKELDFQTLKNDGGVCESWSNYYDEIGRKLGYNTEEIIIKTSEDLYHQFSIWSNEDKYCIIDQTSVYCIDLQ